ncbi:MAG TPA: hypothetical protein VF223_17225 [Trebonia sp.]
MIAVYLWKAGSAEGVTDDHGRARSLAAGFMLANGAAEAVVETAHYGDAVRLLDPGYVRTGGPCWTGRRQGSRVVWRCRWVPAPKPAPALAAAS